MFCITQMLRAVCRLGLFRHFVESFIRIPQICYSASRRACVQAFRYSIKLRRFEERGYVSAYRDMPDKSVSINPSH